MLEDRSALSADTPLKDDLLIGVEAICRYTGDPARRIRHYVEISDRAEAAGQEPDGTQFPFFRRLGMICSRKSWLQAWYSGQNVAVPRGGPKTTKGRKAKASEPEPEPERISPRTGRAVRPYRRRAPQDGAEAGR